ncbi:MAG: B12-binding domain-containing radical SAM protein [Calditrichaeota bacterium]|nr:B12-binding domain-containing radical SAM protein [Calditrichota bacterium]
MKKLRALCINPWIYDFSAYDYFSKPIGLLYVAAYLRQRGVEIDFIDCLDKHHPELLARQGRTRPKLRKFGTGPFHREIIPTPPMLAFIPRRYARYGLPEDIFRKELKRRARPDVVLVTSFMTYWYPGPQRVVQLVREVFPGVPVILGGIYATLMPDHAREVVQPDYIIQGPGEIQVAQLLADWFHLPELKENIPRHIDEYPYPAFDLYRKLDYLIVMTSRGCPFRCTFCATYKIDAQFSQRHPENVVEEILTQTRRLRVRDVAFYDDALLMQPEKRIKPILWELLRQRHQLRFHTPNGLHGRFIDEEMAYLLYANNFRTIRISLESVAKERRRDIHNKITPGEMTRAVYNLVKAGYQPKDIETYIIMGLPTQSIDEVVETMLYAHSLGVIIRLASFSPIPGTVDYQRAIEQGYFPADADPLLTNKTILPLFRTREAYERFHRISQLAHMLNEGAKRGVSLFHPSDFRKALKQALEDFARELEENPVMEATGARE